MVILCVCNVKEMRHEFDEEAKKSGQPRLLLTAAVAAGKSKIDAGYDVPALARLFMPNFSYNYVIVIIFIFITRNVFLYQCKFICMELT